jgi:hypothetical protein
MVKFNAERLIDDCGGVCVVAAALGKTRTAPYRMIRTGYMSTHTLAELKNKFPNLNINEYFEADTDDAER